MKVSELAKIEPTDENLLTLDQIKRVMPQGVHSGIQQNIVDQINNLTQGNEYELYRENILGYARALRDGGWKIRDYVNAVKYVTHKLMGDSNIESYVKVFPERYQDMINKQYEQRHIESRVAIYNKNQLVAKVFEQTLIPTHIVNADIHQKAINHLAYLMISARSEKVQGDAAAKLVDALKMPETTKIELDVGVKDSDTIKELHGTMLELAAMQRKGIKMGVQTAQEVAHSKIIPDIIDGEVIDD